MSGVLNFKKLHFLIIAAIILILALFIGGFLRLKQQQKLAGARAKCLEDVSKMTETQLVEKIGILSRGTETGLGRLNESMATYLVCRTAKNFLGEEKYNEYKTLIDNLELSEETRNKYLAGLAAAYEKKIDFAVATHSLYKLMRYDEKILCPNGREDPKIMEELRKDALRAGFSAEILDRSGYISAYCSEIEEYSKNNESLVKNVYEFNDWDEDPEVRRNQYRWKVIMALRFGGEEKALEFCGNRLNEAEVNNCKDRARYLATASFTSFTKEDIPIDCVKADLLYDIFDLTCRLSGS